MQSRKQREKEFKKSLILEAAIKAFSEKSFEATTMEDIAEKCEFSKPAIYSYYNSKDEIYYDVVFKALETFTEIVVKCSEQAGSVKDFFKKFTYELLAFGSSNKELLLILANERLYLNNPKFKNEEFMQTHSKMENILKKILESSIEKGEARKIDEKKFFKFFETVYFAYCKSLFLWPNSEKISIEKEAEFFSDIILYGILSK